ncbi:MAG: hypothetical protein ACI915_000472 [Gammaproteobacteria bacterium]
MDISSPVFYSIDGDITADQDDVDEAFDVLTFIEGELGIFYVKVDPTVTTLHSVFADQINIEASCSGFPGEFSCDGSADVQSSGNGELTGSQSLASFALLDDFIGAGEEVTSLSIGLFVPGSADFSLQTNIAFAALDVFFDINDGFEQLGQSAEITSLTYVYSPVPIPGAWLLFVSGVWVVRRFQPRRA